MSRDHRLELTLGAHELAALDKSRGHEPRASFVRRVLNEATRPDETARADRLNRAMRGESLPEPDVVPPLGAVEAQRVEAEAAAVKPEPFNRADAFRGAKR